MDRIETSELEAELLRRMLNDTEVIAKYHVYNNGSKIVAEYKEHVTKEHDDMTHLVYYVAGRVWLSPDEVYNSEPYSFYAIFPHGKRSATAYLISRELLQEDIASGKMEKNEQIGVYIFDKEYLNQNSTKKLKF